jgi:hypothetical protein
MGFTVRWLSHDGPPSQNAFAGRAKIPARTAAALIAFMFLFILPRKLKLPERTFSGGNPAYASGSIASEAAVGSNN